jgi:hypothetical protein
MLQLSWAKALEIFETFRWRSGILSGGDPLFFVWRDVILVRGWGGLSLIWMRSSIVYTMSWWPEESGGGGETLVLIHFLLVYNPTPWPNCATVTVVILCAHFSHLWLVVVQHHGSKSWLTSVRHRGSLVFSWLGKHAWCIWSERDIVSRSIPRYIGLM